MKTQLDDGIYCESLVSHRTKDAVVQITAAKNGDAVILQCDADTARQIALQVLECAVSAEFDRAIYAGMQGTLADDALFGLLRMVRDSRGTPVATRSPERPDEERK